MIRYETLAEPWPTFVRSYNAATCLGHGIVVARRVFEHPSQRGVAEVIYFDVRMANGAVRTVTPDLVCDPANVSTRMIAPAPLRIPAPPSRRRWL